MGKYSQEIAANAGGEVWIGSCQAHHVGISPEEDRSRTAGTVGEGEGGEEGGLALGAYCECAAGSQSIADSMSNTPSNRQPCLPFTSGNCFAVFIPKPHGGNAVLN